ncbi:uncharacterized protein LOC132616988 [Lycium barbarum]|uniref:uncharacterized protein LOC132616988 n=1 Tax=Lycium barbarum TaxID=112863 RepID=UPI00293E187D|nr:uncharacterized protein LOC132616988 [Lycium barbarum]
MVRFGKILLKDVGINKSLLEFLVCPLSKRPLRLCEKTNSLISDAIGVSYPIVDGIPRLVPTDGKIIETDDALNSDGSVDSSAKRNSL